MFLRKTLKTTASDAEAGIPHSDASKRSRAAKATPSRIVYALFAGALVLLAIPALRLGGRRPLLASTGDAAEAAAPQRFSDEYWRAWSYEPPLSHGDSSKNNNNNKNNNNININIIDTNTNADDDAAVALLHRVANKDWTTERSRAALAFWERARLVPTAQAVNLSDNIWNLFPDTGACDLNHLKSVGGTPENDGTYWVCTEYLQVEDNCVIFSIGSRGMYEWELEMLALTERKCKIHTFDCTGNWPSPDPLIEFHPWCLSVDYVEEGSQRIFMSWNSILSKLNLTSVDYLKIDIEGGEWIVMPQVLKTGNQLPRQISIEFHRGWQPSGTVNNYALTKFGDAVDNLHPTLNMMSLFYSFGYESVIKKHWGPNFEIFTLVRYPTTINMKGNQTFSTTIQQAPVTNTSIVDYKNIYLTHDWNAVRSREAQDFLELMSKLPAVDSASLKTHVYDLFPETYECDRYYVRSVGGLPFTPESAYICTDKVTNVNNEKKVPDDACTIVTIGSQGQWAFEDEILAITGDKCKVHALDCSGDFTSTNPLITIHKWCIGKKDGVVDGKVYKSWNSIVTELKLLRVDVLKIDAEGWEWVVMPEILQNSHILPLQISIEFHTGSQPSETAAEFMPVQTKQGPDNVKPMVNIMRLFHKAGYHVAIAQAWYIDMGLFTFILDKKLRDETTKLAPKNNETLNEIELLHKITNKDWAFDRGQSAMQIWDLLLEGKPEDFAHNRHRVHQMLPETYQCDRNFLRHVGGLPHDDGSYWVCTEFLQAPECRPEKTVEGFWKCKDFFTPIDNCNLLSIGSNGDFGWEEEMIKLTNGKCKVHTFDCTGSWTPPHELITFHNWCLGRDEVIDGRIYKSWNTIVSELHLDHIDYMKMDIEGWEWVVIPQVFNGAILLPNQISIELHEEWQQPGTSSEMRPVDVPPGGIFNRDHMHAAIHFMKIFYNHGFHMASRKHHGWNCQVITFVRPESVAHGLGATFVGNHHPQPVSAEVSTQIVQEIKSKNWNLDRVKEAQEFWEIAEKLPALYAAKLSNRNIFNMFPITLECDKWWYRSIGGAPTDDGSYWTCIDHIKHTEPECAIVSFGSNGMWAWESELLTLTASNCQIHTFDCTADYVSPHANITFHKLCLGAEDKVIDGKTYKTWNSIISILGVSRIEYLKIDVEGYEWIVLPQIMSTTGGNIKRVFPKQIAVEIHVGWQPEDTPSEFVPQDSLRGKDQMHPMVTLFMRLYSFGYRVVAKKMWSYPGESCQIFTLLKT
ncbi:methyltransferase domain-containing protein [Obelidium mucronatum]|nr:methyltransferase domain-containing protein [Obelidium mucronatum]